MKFVWNRVKAENNVQKHKVSFEEASTVFDDSWQEVYPDIAHSIGEARYICLGMSDKHRVLFVAYTERQGSTRIISARKADAEEELEYYAARNRYLG